MQRYFISDNNWTKEQVHIDGEDRHHIVNVMRMTSGDKIICCNVDGSSYLVEITEITDDKVTGALVEALDEKQEMPVKVTIVQGLPKGDKLELIVQKGTELGMFAFIPVQMDRSIVKWDSKKESKKLSRLRKISKEAAEQSHRSKLPLIHEKHTLKEVLSENTYDHLFVASELEAKAPSEDGSFAEALKQISPGDNLLVVIGPEGGLSNDEISFLTSNQFKSIRLGPRILRTETAPLYVLSAISFYFEEWR
ncbi:16S rRNA (uracil(1498)-N(3))-methyltransferase [Halalkalibacillus sediminis]|uniref:Ribosomal RNA small subunit methyltransferase E n=1 Tax=Halalkalibacillus sediminis TaxID=2018042 RepID=A0A2I0QXK1_9BACI|nr:16S rRNA (uracil(1498)-N(3))-methyltransferase [Halalkalibacillus sediminis]PKR79038.1 16S rRNA (uracil(1498)-N(3))-methyltransferase [Halalkalibacillus sediminis]